MEVRRIVPRKSRLIHCTTTTSENNYHKHYASNSNYTDLTKPNSVDVATQPRGDDVVIPGVGGDVNRVGFCQVIPPPGDDVAIPPPGRRRAGVLTVRPLALVA